MTTERPTGSRWIHWWHLGALLLLVCVVESVGRALGGQGLLPALRALPTALYAWVPTVAGVSLSIRRADARAARAGVAIAVVAVGLMVGLDLASERLPATPATTAARVGDRLSLHASASSGGTGWVSTLTAWQQGELGDLDPPAGVEGGEGRYSLSSPRTRVASALLDVGLVLLVPGVVGLILGMGRWVRARVTFRRLEDEQAAHMVVAWLLAPMVVHLTVALWAEDLYYRALFEGRPLLPILVPFVVVMLAGLTAWVAPVAAPPSDGIGLSGPGPFPPTGSREGSDQRP
jgi:hypothetical protein